MMKVSIPVDQRDTLAALTGFLRQLMEREIVEAVFVPLEADGGAIIPGLVTDPAHLDHANPLAPVMPINAARAVADLTGPGSGIRLAAVMRPCEIRALIELAKLQQATLDDVILIGMDCLGTYEVKDYLGMRSNGGLPLQDYLAAGQACQDPGLDGHTMRLACQMCTNPIPQHANIHLHLYGEDPGQNLAISIDDEIAGQLDLNQQAVAGEMCQPEAFNALIASREQSRQRELAKIEGQMQAGQGLAGIFANCIRCHNCSTACPICYCKTCLFCSTSFEHKPEEYLAAAQRKGALRLLPDTMLFHLTRMTHMSASCVSCGACTSACPMDIPVGAIFSAVSEHVQTALEYRPGRSREEPLPLLTFQANEWTKIGEAG